MHRNQRPPPVTQNLESRHPAFPVPAALRMEPCLPPRMLRRPRGDQHAAHPWPAPRSGPRAEPRRSPSLPQDPSELAARKGCAGRSQLPEGRRGEEGGEEAPAGAGSRHSQDLPLGERGQPDAPSKHGQGSTELTALNAESVVKNAHVRGFPAQSGKPARQIRKEL